MSGFDEDIKLQIVNAMRRLYERELVSAVGGNVSFRVPNRNYIWITPSGLFKGGLQSKDLVKVSLDGNVLEGTYKPSSELPSHLSIYKIRNDVNAVVHAHPPFATGLFTAGYILKNVTPEYVLLIGEPKVIDFVLPGYHTSQVISKTISMSNVIVIKNHGVFCVGNNIEEALARVEVLEEAAKMVVAAKLFNSSLGINDHDAEEIKRIYKKS
ncbi:MAG: class II aldolase/adducin family protein [Thermoprotei archaeon]|jgi:L-fuculose-phosphate aldolase